MISIGHKNHATVLFLILFSIFLASCTSHVKRNDGPPGYYVDVSRIPDARPRPERLSKYGNKPSYVVFGKRYYVMHSSKNYSARGVASWYGTLFHRRSTSSGEPYNMLAMTAAHKSLPLPTYVEVTNLNNHRKVIVKVNDRGPFHSNRLIDLSYVAAKKLGMLGHGTAPVQVTAIDPYCYGRPQPIYRKPIYRKPIYRNTNTIYMASNKHQHNYRAPTATLTQQDMASSWRVVRRSPASKANNVYLQVGAFKNKINALKMQRRLLTLLHTHIIVTSPYAHHPYFRVKIGPFKDVATVNRLTMRLKHLGIAANRIYGA